MKLEPKFKVNDLLNCKILSGDDIPKIEGNLPEILRQFSGQTYELCQFTGCIDFNGKEIYHGDYVNIYRLKSSDEFKVEKEKISFGQVVFTESGGCVTVLNNENEIDIYNLNNSNFDFEWLGDYYYNEQK